MRYPRERSGGRAGKDGGEGTRRAFRGDNGGSGMARCEDQTRDQGDRHGAGTFSPSARGYGTKLEEGQGKGQEAGRRGA